MTNKTYLRCFETPTLPRVKYRVKMYSYLTTLQSADAAVRLVQEDFDEHYRALSHQSRGYVLVPIVGDYSRRFIAEDYHTYRYVTVL